MKINKKIRNINGTVVNGYEVDNGAFVVDTVTDRDNIPELYRSNCMVSVVEDESIAVYTGADFIDGSWTSLSNWISVGGGAAGIQGTATLYVNQSSGNDTTGDGSSGSPYATILKALGSLQQIITGIVTINISAGNYNESTALDVISGFTFTRTGELIIEGSTSEVLSDRAWTASRLEITSQVPFSATENEYEGNFIHPSTNDDYFPIQSNDLTTYINGCIFITSGNVASVRKLDTLINFGALNVNVQFDAFPGKITMKRLEMIGSGTHTYSNTSSIGGILFFESSLKLLKLVISNVNFDRCYIKTSAAAGYTAVHALDDVVFSQVVLSGSNSTDLLKVENCTAHLYNNTFKNGVNGVQLTGPSATIINSSSRDSIEPNLNANLSLLLFEDITNCIAACSGSTVNFNPTYSTTALGCASFLNLPDDARNIRIDYSGMIFYGDSFTDDYISNNTNKSFVDVNRGINIYLPGIHWPEVDKITDTLSASATNNTTKVGDITQNSYINIDCVLTRGSAIAMVNVKMISDGTELFMQPPVGDDVYTLLGIDDIDFTLSTNDINLVFHTISGSTGTVVLDIKRTMI